MLSSKSDGSFVRSLDDNSTKFVSTRQHNFSHLESIEVFTTKDNTNLANLFDEMKKSKEKLPETKADSKELKTYFEKVYPDLDFERVYTSEMKNMVKWYQILDKNKIDIKVKSPEEIEETAVDSMVNAKPGHKETAHVKDMKPQKSTTRKIESRGVK